MKLFSSTALLVVRVVSLLSDFELSRQICVSKTRNRGLNVWTVLIPSNTINKPENMLSIEPALHEVSLEDA